MIKNKKVIFVGPSNYLIGKNKGKYIDSFDIVVRSGNAINMNKNLYNDYGSRTDIIYLNNPFVRACYPLPLNEWKEKGLKEIVIRDNFTDIINAINKIIKCRSCYEIHKELSDKLSGAILGSYLITDIIKQNPKSFYLTGITFYNKGHDYYKGYERKEIKELKRNEKKTRKKPIKVHSYNNNNNYIKEMIKKYNIKTDEYIKEII